MSWAWIIDGVLWFIAAFLILTMFSLIREGMSWVWRKVGGDDGEA